MQQIQLFINSLELYTLSYVDIPDPSKIKARLLSPPIFTGSGKASNKKNPISSIKETKIKKTTKEKKPVLSNKEKERIKESYGVESHKTEKLVDIKKTHDIDYEEHIDYTEPPFIDEFEDDIKEYDADTTGGVYNDAETTVCQLIINNHTPVFYIDNQTGNSCILGINLNNTSIDIIFTLFDYNLYLAYLISLLISICYNNVNYVTSKNNILTYMNVNKRYIDKTELNFAEKNIVYFKKLIDMQTIIENNGEYTLENLNSLTVDQLNKSILKQSYINFIKNKINNILNPSIVKDRINILHILALIYIAISSEMYCYTFETLKTISDEFENLQ